MSRHLTVSLRLTYRHLTVSLRLTYRHLTVSMRQLATKLRKRAGALAIDNFFRTAARVGKMHPRARPSHHGVEVHHDLAYTSSGRREHLLDVYRPIKRDGPLPVVLYVHGGGFRILSKDTHWVMGLAFARAGYLVFNISYRLAPRHRFPTALEDCADAFNWVLDHGASFGGDLDRLVFAGESAGANLITAMTVMACYERDEPWAKRIYERNIVPKAFMPFCGVLQVSDAERFRRRRPKKIGTFISDRLQEVSGAYLGENSAERHGATMDLADPLLLFERGDEPSRPLPPCFAAVGTADPLLDDTRRLATALTVMGVEHEAHYYERQVHAFHAMVWTEPAQRCWRDSFRFLNRICFK
jgi:acetyl esterase